MDGVSIRVQFKLKFKTWIMFEYNWTPTSLTCSMRHDLYSGKYGIRYSRHRSQQKTHESIARDPQRPPIKKTRYY